MYKSLTKQINTDTLNVFLCSGIDRLLVWLFLLYNNVMVMHMI